MTGHAAAGQLMGHYLTGAISDPQADIWPAIAAFVAEASPVTVRRTADALAALLRQAAEDQELAQLYWMAGGRFQPDPSRWSLRDCLEQVARYLRLHVDDSITDALMEFSAYPAGLVRATINRSGRFGRDWLRTIPANLAAAARAWDLELGENFTSTTDLVVAATREDGTPAVLRMGQGGAYFAAAAAMLELCEGVGAVHLLESDLETGVVLIERAVPGTPLSTLVPHDDRRATAVAAQTLQVLWRAAPEPVVELDSIEYDGPFPFVAWVREDLALYDSTWADRGPVSHDLVRDAERIVRELLVSAPESPTLLHGDLHHDNIVSSDRAPGGWLAIDPKGWVGDPGYDIGALLYNPLDFVAGVPDLGGLLDRRLRQLAEQLEMDEGRLRAWGFVKAVLSEIWFVEDDGHPHGVPLRVAQELRSRL